MNVLVKREKGASPTFVLADFGTAVKLSGPFAKATPRIGTLGYLSPELIKGMPYGCGTDIFSLGALMHFIVTRRVPFEQTNKK